MLLSELPVSSLVGQLKGDVIGRLTLDQWRHWIQIAATIGKHLYPKISLHLKKKCQCQMMYNTEDMIQFNTAE